MTRPSFTIELATDARFARDLSAGGVFVPVFELRVLDEIDLVVRGTAGELRLCARVVYVDPATGCGLELVGFGPELKEQLARLADEGGDDGGDGDGDDREGLALNLPERLRNLTLAQQLKVARGPSASARMTLERMYGKNVWEALLHNPGLTVPEVAKLARLGTLPRPLLEVIVGNSTWLQVPEVRRALLANPRLGADQVIRVLRLLPKHELKLAATMPTYPHAVRSAAKKLMDD